MKKHEISGALPLEHGEGPAWPMQDLDTQLGPDLDTDVKYNWPESEPTPVQEAVVAPTPEAGNDEKATDTVTSRASEPNADKPEATTGPQDEVLKPLDPEFVKIVAEITGAMHKKGDEEISPLTNQLKALREPENGWWEASEAWRLGAADLKSSYPNGQENFLEVAKEEALTKKTEERDAFDNFLLGSRTTHPKDMISPDPNKSVVEYYSTIDDHLLEAFDKGVLPAEFTDRAVLEKTINALIRRSVGYFVKAGHSLDGHPVQKAATLLEKAALSVPGFNPQNAGASMLYGSMLTCRAVLDAESPNRTFVRGGMYDKKIDQVANTVAKARYAAERAMAASAARSLYAYRKAAPTN